MVPSQHANEPGSTRPLHLYLTPVRSRKGERWWVELRDDVVSLWGTRNTPVLVIPRESVADHVRFAWDVVYGHTVSFVVMEGMKSYVFKCPREVREPLLNWLPRKADHEVRREVRVNAVSVALFGVLFLALGHEIPLHWGVLFLTAGLFGLITPHRAMYAMNGTLMFLFGITQILEGGAISPYAMDTSNAIAAIAVTVFICWGVQQFGMLSTNAQIRAARVTDGRRLRTARPQRVSPLVQKTGKLLLHTSAFFWAYTVGLALAAHLGNPAVRSEGALSDVQLAQIDLLAFLILAVFTTFMGAVITLKKRPAYVEAKLALQAIIVVVTIVGCGFYFTFDPSTPLSFFGPVLSTGGVKFAQPSLWALLLVAMLGFNRWFARAVDRELEEDTSLFMMFARA